ncbi:MAG: metallophosphoesterase family protein [Defluviimonas sp.]|uniref:metallophosphoesterase family protein n=1 Tax=Albidovulum sp. TaxID=1872424 RepID=UPI001D51B7AD|nr:metallophosphoesterase family protein [Paracoccaceae bacterium]MCC0065136.1 metallophosphoesterase family protein [Defluviimonas sp.]
MRVLAFSDLHLDIAARDRILAAAGNADLIVGAGDFASRREGLESFVAPFGALAGKAVFVAGNNETVDELRAATPVRVLHGETISMGGLRIAGLGAAVPPLPPLPWASFDLTEEMATRLLDGIETADILISHSPPKGVCDRHARIGPIGSDAVLAAARRLEPRYLLCGHVHDDWGARGMIGETEVMNLGPRPTWIET